MNLKIKKSKKIFLFIFIISLFLVCCLELYLISNDTYIGDEDAAAYALLGENIANGDGLTTNVIWLHINKYNKTKHPEDYWPPLQSYIIAFSISLLGKSLFTIKLPNIVGYFLLIITIYLIGTSLFSQKVGILSALICLFTSDLCLYSLSSRNEIIYLLLIMICFYCLSKSYHNRLISRKYILISGIVVGFAFLQKPISLMLVFSYIVWFSINYLTDKEQEYQVQRNKHSIISLSIFLLSFSLIISPYILRNIIYFNNPLPPLPTQLSAIYLNSYKCNNDKRNINSDLSHYEEMRYLYYENIPKVDYTSLKELICVAKKGMHELLIMALMLKRSYVTQITMVFLTFLSLFIIKGTAKNFLELFIIYLFTNIILISFHQHTEQRYYIFMIPVVSIFSSYILFWFEKLILDMNLKRKKNLYIRWKYWGLIVLFLFFTTLLPNIRFLIKQTNNLSKKRESMIIGEWLAKETPTNSIIMTNKPYRISYYSGRPTVQLPIAPANEIFDLCRHFNVSHLIISEDAIKALKMGQEKKSGEKSYVEINSIGSKKILKFLKN